MWILTMPAFAVSKDVEVVAACVTIMGGVIIVLTLDVLNCWLGGKKGRHGIGIGLR